MIVSVGLRLAATCAIVLVVGVSVAAAARRIPSSELPGRERERFVDPPAARLLQPGVPTTALPHGARHPDLDNRTRTKQRKQRWRKRAVPSR